MSPAKDLLDKEHISYLGNAHFKHLSFDVCISPGWPISLEFPCNVLPHTFFFTFRNLVPFVTNKDCTFWIKGVC